MGPNVVIWIAIAVVAASSLAMFHGYDWTPGVGYPVAIALAVLNMIRAARRKLTDVSRAFD